ncbi:hypothetical protein ESZ53_06075 [Salinibacterium sp. UTAS2018]|uniref:hypothetical protein n=1 Tax=Salinibacterium sp. UTAS2018 TaxID=2508880 RepID=UPI0010095DE4|nr:hypothetical protein [Salinibacterium sp. UTAS2018]QAV70039.1 hypothetical protein ESZ53_06075 [Salinibacterium sp. UTAS2018]
MVVGKKEGDVVRKPAVDKEEDGWLSFSHRSIPTFLITLFVSAVGLVGLFVSLLTDGSPSDVSLGAPLLFTAIGAFLIAVSTLFKQLQPEYFEHDSYRLHRRGYGEFSATATSCPAKKNDSKVLIKAVKFAARWDAFVIGLELAGAIVLGVGAFHAFTFWYNS